MSASKNKDDIAVLMDKAQRSLDVAEQLLQDGHADFSASRAYYAMYYAAEAVLLDKDIRVKSHRGLQNQFWQILVKPGELPEHLHRILGLALEVRQEGDYEVSETSFLPTTAEDRIKDAKEFVAEIKKYLT